ncbi:MAG: hypothetical protein ACSHYB_16125 [Roseibacillus sp.]
MMARKTIKRILLFGLVILSPFLLILAIVFLPEATKQPPPPQGEVVFPSERPQLKPTFSKEPYTGKKFDWLHDGVDDLMTWDKNPWRTPNTVFGDHYWNLLNSKDPADQAKVAELLQWADALYQRILERYPELAVEYKNIPPKENGFLKWLEFCERLENSDNSPLKIPKTLQNQIDGKSPWDSELTKQWLTENQSLLNELREIGLTPEQSTKDINIDRWGFLGTRPALEAFDILLLDARLSIEEGNTAAALESVQATRGLADHFLEIETPTLLSTTVGILGKLQSINYTLTELIPVIPVEELRPSQWEDALSLQTHPPATLGRVLTGEWHAGSRYYTLPMLSNTDDPHYPSDPDAVIDYNASSYLQLQQTYHSEEVKDWNSITPPFILDPAHLSRNSRKFAEVFNLNSVSAWTSGFQRFNNQNALTQAAFAIMRGEPVPNDPIYNQPYQWDPVTRELSPPDTPEFKLNSPITVPPAP